MHMSRHWFSEPIRFLSLRVWIRPPHYFLADTHDRFAFRFRFQMVESELLVKSLLDEGAEGLTQRILTKAGVDTSRFSADLDSFMYVFNSQVEPPFQKRDMLRCALALFFNCRTLRS